MRTTAELQKLYEAYLLENRLLREPRELYEPFNYIMELGGKRLRPVLALLGYQLFRGDSERALPVAHAVEIFHNFSLVHDDIMDQAPLRRGQPTVHRHYGVNTAILSGDVMLIYAYEALLLTRDKSVIPELVRVFNRVAVEVCEGQQRDMNFEQRAEVTIEEYLQMISQKTAALIAGALELGGIVAGATVEDRHNLSAFGRNIGIAFQLQDDILDTFGDPEKFGKKIGGDIVQNKKTYLILKALEVARTPDRTRLQTLMNSHADDEAGKIAEVTQLLEGLGIRDLAEAEKQRYQQAAFDYLHAVKVSDFEKQALTGLTEKLIGRES